MKNKKRYTGEFKTLGELLQAVSVLPCNEIKVQNSLQYFQPFSVRLEGDLVSKVEKLLLDLLERDEKDFGKVECFYLRSYFGDYSDRGFYISMETKGSYEFGVRMSRGDYGSLD